MMLWFGLAFVGVTMTITKACPLVHSSVHTYHLRRQRQHLSSIEFEPHRHDIEVSIAPGTPWYRLDRVSVGLDAPR